MNDNEQRKAALNEFVSLLRMAKEAIILYRKLDSEIEPSGFEEIDYKDVLMTAHSLIALSVTGDQKTEMVKLDPPKVHDAFGAVLEHLRIDRGAAEQVCSALVATPAGQDMLRLMLHDAVMRNRKSQGGTSPPGRG